MVAIEDDRDMLQPGRQRKGSRGIFTLCFRGGTGCFSPNTVELTATGGWRNQNLKSKRDPTGC